MTNDLEKFDARLDDFLKKRLTQDEEHTFISELNANPHLLDRAQTIALAIEQMQELKKEQGDKIINLMKGISKEQYLEDIWKSPLLEEFDDKVNRFLKKMMTEQEESEFKKLLKNNPQYKERAQLIALTIKNMGEIRKEEGERVTASIARIDKDIFREQVGIKTNFESAGYETGSSIAAAPAAKVIPLWRNIKKIAVAACFIGVISFGGFRYYQYEQTIQLGKTYISVISTDNISRGTDDIGNLKVWLNNVAEDKDLSKTAINLGKLYNESTGEEYNDYSPFANTIGWYAAIAYLKDGNRKEARIILVSIRKLNKGKSIAAEANKLIDEIDDI